MLFYLNLILWSLDPFGISDRVESLELCLPSDNFKACHLLQPGQLFDPFNLGLNVLLEGTCLR
jgi:hypothetical protein